MTTVDWGDAPSVRSFYGRADETQEVLAKLAMGERRFVLLHGVKGAGKTRLSLGVVQVRNNDRGLLKQTCAQIDDRFDHVVWRSLLNAPPLDELLHDIAPAIPAPLQAVNQSGSDLVDLLLDKARGARCLIILDNLESLLEPGEGSNFRSDTKDYEGFIRRFAETDHDSCLIATSREVPDVLVRLCGPKSPDAPLPLSVSMPPHAARFSTTTASPTMRPILRN